MFAYKHAETKFIKCNKRGGGGWNKRGVDFFLFLRTKFAYLLHNLSANVFYELLEGKNVENKKAKFSLEVSSIKKSNNNAK